MTFGPNSAATPAAKQHPHAPGGSIRRPGAAVRGRSAGYLWSAAGIAAATACFWLLRASAHVDKGQASLLYLPAVILCAVRFGFGPAVLAAVLSFLCWNFFLLPPYYTLIVRDPRDWLSLFVFLVAAVTTGRLASLAREEAEQARAREAEVATLFEASEAISREVSAARLLEALSRQIRTLCHASRCVVFRRGAQGSALRPTGHGEVGLPPERLDALRRLAELACEHDLTVGLGSDSRLWAKAMGEEAGAGGALAEDPGAFVPLHAGDALVGVLHVGPRDDGQPFFPVERRLILALANHAATVIAREGLAEEAAQAAALRQADALKDALLSLVSHELRTPLAAIKASATGLLQDGARWDDAAGREALAAIDQEADRLTALVNNLLDLSRLEAGVWKPAKDWCDLSDVLPTVLDRLPEPTAARVEADIAPDLPLLRADYTQVALVLENLLVNAAKYAPVGPVAVRMAAEPGGGRVTVSVRDHGPGLTPGEEARVFTRFFRGSRHQNGPVHGTGLGLALCDAIVRAHGGDIRAENAAGGGAVFTFRLPVA